MKTTASHSFQRKFFSSFILGKSRGSTSRPINKCSMKTIVVDERSPVKNFLKGASTAHISAARNTSQGPIENLFIIQITILIIKNPRLPRGHMKIHAPPSGGLHEF